MAEKVDDRDQTLVFWLRGDGGELDGNQRCYSASQCGLVDF